MITDNGEHAISTGETAYPDLRRPSRFLAPECRMPFVVEICNADDQEHNRSIYQVSAGD